MRPTASSASPRVCWSAGTSGRSAVASSISASAACRIATGLEHGVGAVVEPDRALGRVERRGDHLAGEPVGVGERAGRDPAAERGTASRSARAAPTTSSAPSSQ